MAIFTHSNGKAVEHANTTIIAAGTRIKGEIESKCKIHVDGEFSGPIHCDSMISIGRSGFVEGDLRAKELVVTGYFSGMAICEKIHILAGGKITGRITSNMLEIERGCIFHGQHTFKKTVGEIKRLIQSESALNKSDDLPHIVTAIPVASEMAV